SGPAGPPCRTRRGGGRVAVTRDILIGATLLASGIVLGFASCATDELATNGPSEGQVPIFEGDPLWPKPLPEPWILGSVVGVSVDSRDHVWIIHRTDTFDERTESNAATDPPTASCCAPAPPILEFDPEGNLVGGWGGPGEGYDWPQSNHGITVDHLDNVWIGGNGQ